MVHEYVSLNVEQGDEHHRKSFRRTWNQLSRLQRSLIYVCLLSTLLLCFYIWSNTHKTNDTTAQIILVEPNKLQSKDEPKAEKLDEIVKSVPPAHVEEPKIENEVGVPRTSLRQFHFSGPSNPRQVAVVNAFKHSWAGYKKYAWGHDMLKPLSKTYHDWFGLGLTLVDALDTMYIMNLQSEFEEARDWVASSLSFDVNREVNLFEVTIRVLGGLLSAFHLSGDQMFLEKATDLGARLLPCFNTESGVPFSDINLATMRAHSPKWSPDSSTSEVTTIQLEFRALSRATGEPKYESAAARVSEHVHNLPKTQGLVPIFINAQTGQFRAFSTITLGARGDSYYEYLLKQWIQTGRTVDYLKEDYIAAIDGVEKLLMRRTPKNKLLYIGELLTGGKDFKPKMDHLTCYLPGTLALGVHYGLPEQHMQLAEELAYTCYMTYAMQPTFLAPEISYFSIGEGGASDIYVKSNDAHNLLRPELLESLWVMYQVTGNATYQEWGWNIFQGFEKHTRVPNGYTSIGSVQQPLNTRPKDMMESFFLGETLKYLYLLFSDERQELSLDRFVINTEAHPLPVYPS